MRGIEKIVDQILQEAYDKQTEILDEAHIEVEKINALSNEKVKTMEEEGKRDEEAALKQVRELSRLSVEQKRRREILEKKQELIGSLMEKAYERLLALDDEKYFGILVAILEKFALDEDGEIYLNHRDLKRLPSSFKNAVLRVAEEKGVSLKLQDMPKDIDAGFVLVYGGIEENCTFRGLIDSNREDLQDLVQRILFA